MGRLAKRWTRAFSRTGIEESGENGASALAVDQRVPIGIGKSAVRPTPAEISARAYAFYLARGAKPGGDKDDWFRAEQELLEEYRFRV